MRLPFVPIGGSDKRITCKIKQLFPIDVVDRDNVIKRIRRAVLSSDIVQEQAMEDDDEEVVIIGRKLDTSHIPINLEEDGDSPVIVPPPIDG